MADSQINSNVLQSLQKMFGIGFSKKGKDKEPEIFPVDTKRDRSGNQTLNRTNFDPDVQRLWEWWSSQTHTLAKDFDNRKNLYEDMDLLYYNEQLISRAIELVADETLQADSNDQLIFVDAKQKVKKFILNFFDEISLYDYLRPMIVDVIQYGNALWLLGFDAKGINEIIPINIYNFKDRMEFTPYEVKLKMQNKDRLFMDFAQLDRVSQLIDSIQNKENCTSYFKKYLFGYQVEDYCVPPWKAIHFRNLTNKSPFAPFGIPMYVHAMSSYRQKDAAMTLQQAARGARFPKDIWEIDLPNVINPTDKFEKATEFLNEFNNVGLGNSKKQMPGLGDVIVTIKDFMTYNQVTPNIDLGRIDDIEMLRDDIIVATMLPRYIIDPKDSGFGDSGISMIEKWKPFARLIYRVQNIVLQNITQLVKLQMIYSQEFSVDDIDFTLSMKYPESQTSGDIVSSQSSLLDLANNVISAIQDKVTGGEQLPADLIKDIYTQFLPYDTNKIEKWIDDSIKAKADGETIPVDGGGVDDLGADEFGFADEDIISNTGSVYSGEKPDVRKLKAIDPNHVLLQEKRKASKMWETIKKEVGRERLKEIVHDITFEEKQKTLREGTIRERHFYSSKNKNVDFDPIQLREFDKKRLEKLKEGIDDKQYMKEEVQYKFTFDSDDDKK